MTVALERALWQVDRSWDPVPEGWQGWVRLVLPSGLLLEAEAGDTRLLLRDGSPDWPGSERLRLGGRSGVPGSLRQAAFDPGLQARFARSLGPSGLPEPGTRLERRRAGWFREGALWAAVPARGSQEAPTPVLRALEGAWTQASALEGPAAAVAAWGSGPWSDAAARLVTDPASLAGWGPGLTPAGDDALCGWAAARVLRSGFRPKHAALLETAAERTARLGRHALKAAARGHFIEPLRRLVCSPGGPEAWPRTTAWRELSAWGHSSGRVLLTALIQTLREPEEALF